MEKIIGIYYPIDYDIKYNPTEYSTVLTYTLAVPICMGWTGTDNKIYHIRDNLYDCWNNKNHTEN